MKETPVAAVTDAVSTIHRLELKNSLLDWPVGRSAGRYIGWLCQTFPPHPSLFPTPPPPFATTTTTTTTSTYFTTCASRMNVVAIDKREPGAFRNRFVRLPYG